MKKAAGHISVIIKEILCIGFSIRIILGIIWMCFNFTHLQEFQQTEGILYRCLKNLLGGNYGLLYAFQLATAYYAADRFLQKTRPTNLFWRIWGNLVLLTFPMAMQCHLAVSPYSLVSSFLLLELSAAIAVVREKDGNMVREYVLAGFCWLILALLLPEYFVLGAIPLLLVLLIRLPALLKRRSSLANCVLVFLAFGGMIVGIHGLTGEADYLPDRESISYSLFSRTVWPTIWHDSAQWPAEVKAAVDGSVWEVSLYTDNMQKIFRPLMQESFGHEQASEYYLQMAAASLKKHTVTVIRQIGGDVLGYSVTPLILPIQLRGEAYASYSGRNYEMMFIQAPLVTKYYVNYSCWWFGVMLVLTALLFVMKQAEHLTKPRRSGVWAFLLCLITAGTVVTAYTLRGAGVMDYKCTVAVNLLWPAAALLLMGKKDTLSSGEGENSEEAERERI